MERRPVANPRFATPGDQVEHLKKILPCVIIGIILIVFGILICMFIIKPNHNTFTSKYKGTRTIINQNK